MQSVSRRGIPRNHLRPSGVDQSARRLFRPRRSKIRTPDIQRSAPPHVSKPSPLRGYHRFRGLVRRTAAGSIRRLSSAAITRPHLRGPWEKISRFPSAAQASPCGDPITVVSERRPHPGSCPHQSRIPPGSTCRRRRVAGRGPKRRLPSLHALRRRRQRPGIEGIQRDEINLRRAARTISRIGEQAAIGRPMAAVEATHETQVPTTRRSDPPVRE